MAAAVFVGPARLGRGAQEGERERVAALGKVVGKPLGAYEHHRHGLVPQPPQAAPRGRHGVEAFGRAGRHQHPFRADGPEHIVGQGLHIDFFHSLMSFLLKNYINVVKLRSCYRSGRSSGSSGSSGSFGNYWE